MPFRALDLLFGPPDDAKAKAKKTEKNNLLFVDYEGPADLGRISIRIGRNFSTAGWDTHPRVLSEQKPWKKRLDLNDADTSTLMDLASSASVKSFRCKTPVLMPGQDFTIKNLRLSIGKSPPLFTCSFVETPTQLQTLLLEIQKIFERVKSEGRSED